MENNLVEEKLFCAAPWNHFFVQQDGDVRACCMVGGQGEVLGNINEQTWDEIWEGEKFQDLRRRFLEKDPETLKQCKHCLDYDKFGAGSCRHQFNGFVKNTESAVNSIIRTPRIKSLDLRTSRKCGLACLICGPWNSTRWSKETGFTNPRAVTEQGLENVKQLVEDLKKQIIHVNIVGGEPFIMDEALHLINELQPYKKHVKILINTNCQTLHYKGQDVLKLLEGFEYIQIDASIDAIGSAAEYQRYGCKWEVIKQNFEKLLDTPFKIWVHPTISIFNILRVPELLEYLEGLKGRNFEICGGNMLFEPEEYNIQNLPVEVKRMIKRNLEGRIGNLSDSSKTLVRGWINHMNLEEPVVSLKQIMQRIKMNDERRQNSFLEINPEFREYVE